VFHKIEYDGQIKSKGRRERKKLMKIRNKYKKQGREKKRE
jgi:hypothetical protein